MLVVIKGAGDIATGIALRLYKARFVVIMTEQAAPTAIRRTVCFSLAAQQGEATVEGVRCVLAPDIAAARASVAQGDIPLLIDPLAACIPALRPDAVVDAILAKYNTGTHRTDAPVVIGIGPGFVAGVDCHGVDCHGVDCHGVDCHAVIETARGHTLGRVITQGGAIANTGVPGDIGGYTIERLLRAPVGGIFEPFLRIGDIVQKGDIAAAVNGVPIPCQISGVLRGLLPGGMQVAKGMKCGDVDPRCEVSHCYQVSDKALAVGGGVLEALLQFTPNTTISLRE